MKALRVGLFVDGWRVPAWVAAVAADVMASNTAEIAAVITRPPMDKRTPLPRYRPHFNPIRLSQMYLYLDHHIVQPPRDALESVNVKELWKQPPVVEAAPKF